MSEKIYYTSDYHFFHDVSFNRSGHVYFDSIEIVHKEIIYRHNQKVKPEDHIFILGDILVCDEAELEDRLSETVDQLKGHLHLILGNHDYKYLENESFIRRFQTIDEANLNFDTLKSRNNLINSKRQVYNMDK